MAEQEKPTVAGLHERLSQLEEIIDEFAELFELVQDALFGTDVRPHLAVPEEVTSE